MTEPIRCPIVGSKFYPPAMEILLFLPVGTKLLALSEPNNPHDPNAIQVWIETRHIPQITLDKMSGPRFGPAIPNLFDQSAWQLGHVGAEFALRLKGLGFKDCNGTYTVGSNGGNRILLPGSYK